MDSLLNIFLSFAILLNFIALGSSRMKGVIHAAAIQGIFLGFMPLFRDDPTKISLILICAATIAMKGLFIPMMLHRAMREVQIRREVELIIGLTASLLAGALGTGLCIVFANSLPLIASHNNTLIVPASFSTILTGFLILFSRRKAITQVVGYLILENGIFIFGLLLVQAMPTLVEVGALLDLFVGILVMGIILHHIQRTFSSLDTLKLTALRE